MLKSLLWSPRVEFFPNIKPPNNKTMVGKNIFCIKMTYSKKVLQFDYDFSGFVRSTNIIGALKQGFKRINKVGNLDSRRQNLGSNYFNNIEWWCS